ncbi:MAG TPA: hypothetical protein VGQ63_19030 [Pseudolabrys sp.]|jgi:hypothetical protein|nr:hypothetical protein [Pseudolabrys sp.]
MPIDLSQVDWLYVALLAIFVFVTAYVGGFLAFGRRWTAALASTVLFVALFVFWTYYPHRVPGPRAISLPGATTTTAVPAPAAPAAPAAPQKPRNPVTDITPRNPVTDVTPPAAPAAPASPPAEPAPPPAAPAPAR